MTDATTKRAIVTGTGSYLPERIMSNSDLEKIVETSDEWIQKRTGIKQRHIAADDQPTSDMAIKAARQAMAAAGKSPEDIDGIVVATTTPDQTFPSVAVRVQEDLAIPVCAAFDVQAVCSGFVYALSTANNMILTGQNRCILVIGAEKMSSILDWSDRSTCVLFGDGAGAVILESREVSHSDNDRPCDIQGICSTHLFADGNLREILYTNGGPSTTGHSGYIVMEGKEVFRHAVSFMADVVKEALKKNQISAEDIDWLVPHQANTRIIERTAKKLKLPMDKIILTVDRHGNTSAASIPLALDAAVREERIKAGELVLLEALGAGLTWGAALVRM